MKRAVERRDRPNILIFMADQQQAQVVEPAHPCPLPHIEQLARDGVRFTRAYTPAAHCCPSRTTFMTGLVPSRHGVYNNVLNDQAIRRTPRAGVTMFSEYLKAVGYNLFYSGKWHVSAEELPRDRGWDEGVITSKVGDHNGRTYAEWEAMARDSLRGGDRPRGYIDRPGWGPFHLYGTIPDQGAEAYEGTEDFAVVSAGIEAMESMAEEDDPWVLFIGTHGPHDPYVVPETYAAMFDPDDVVLPANFHDNMADKPRIYQRQRQQLWDQLSEAEVREAIAHYWAYCRMVDDLFGRVLAALDQTGQADNTAVFFTSDHGDYAGAHGLFLKGVPAFDEAYHIPLVVRWPKGTAQTDRVVDEFVTLADFAPTFLELAGVPVPEGGSGRSFLPLLRGEVPNDWPDAFHSQFNGVELYYTQRIVQTKRYKYVYNGFDFDELYDLHDDPHELVNQVDNPQYRAVKRALIRRLWDYARQEEDPIQNPYATTALVPYGPMESMRDDGEETRS